MVNGGRPPLPPRKRSSDPGMTPDTGEGGPLFPIPAIQVEVDLGIRWFLLPTESRSNFPRPSTTLGQPPLVPPPLPVDRRSSFRLFRSTATPTTPTPTCGTPTYAGGRGGVPRGETVKRSAGVQGAASPLLGVRGRSP